MKKSELKQLIREEIRTGVGSSDVKRVKHINEIPSTPPSNNMEAHPLQNIKLINPTHITLKNSGHGEFPDSYQLTPEGVKYILKSLKILKNNL